MNNKTPEQKRKQIEGLVKLGALGIAGFLVAPIIFITIKGIVGLAAAAIIGIGIVNFAPVAGKMIANWRLKALKAEASRNPVETLQNDYVTRQEKLAEYKGAITSFAAEIMNFQDKLEGFIKSFPNEADKFKDQLSKMKQLLKIRQQKFKQADQGLKEYELEIQKAGAIWDMGQAAAAMTQAAGMTEDDFLAKIMVETALTSVQKNLNSALAELETSLEEEKDSPKSVKQDTQDYNQSSPTVINQRQKIAEA